jgi:chorismate mutase
MSQSPPALADLRREIDRIDEAMHRLLMERGEIIERLIAVKGTTDSGQAFRPGREASMMRLLAQRHAGLLPLDTVESIWRVIIATFTWVQAPYAVHADTSAGDGPMRDTARFHFGFTAPYVPQTGAGEVIAAVAGSRGDLGIFRMDQGASAGPWWLDLVEPSAPKIIARLPFIERPHHPAGVPVFVISKPLAEAAVRDVVLLSVRLERWREGARAPLHELGCEIVASAGLPSGLSALVAVPGGLDPARLREALERAGAAVAELAEVGSHAERFHMPRADGG